MFVQMQTSAQKVQMTATSTPSARTRPNPSTASANRVTREMASSARVSGLSTLSHFFFTHFPSSLLSGLINSQYLKWILAEPTTGESTFRTGYDLSIRLVTCVFLKADPKPIYVTSSAFAARLKSRTQRLSPTEWCWTSQ